jgi:hypothetical protein
MNALKNVNGFRNYNSKNIEKSIGEVIRCFSVLYFRAKRNCVISRPRENGKIAPDISRAQLSTSSLGSFR